jgi:hypothetical protein
MPEAILRMARDGDVVMCMGAGSIGGVPTRWWKWGRRMSRKQDTFGKSPS